MNIDNLLHKGKYQPYHIPIRVRVIKKSETRYYQNEGRDRNLTNLGLADQTNAIQSVCYDEQKLAKLNEAANVMLRNYILREQKIIITSQTAISKTSSVGHIPNEILQKAVAAVQPCDSTKYTIAGAKALGMGQTISVTAKVTRVNDKTQRTLTRTNEKVDYRTITLTDTTGEITLSLWISFALIDIQVGQFYNVANVRTSIYNQEVTLNNSYHTRLEIVDTPVTFDKYILVAFDTEGEKVQLVCKVPESDEYKDFDTTEDKMVALVRDDDDFDVY